MSWETNGNFSRDDRTDETLIGYLLEALDEDDLAKVEVQLRTEPEIRWRLEQLRSMLDPLAADTHDPGPSPGLRPRNGRRAG